MQSLGPSFCFLCHTTSDASLIDSVWTGSILLPLTICFSFFVTLLWTGRGVFLAVQKIACDPGINFNWQLSLITCPLDECLDVNLSRPWQGKKSVPGSPNSSLDKISAKRVWACQLPFHSTSRLSDPRSISWWHHQLWDVSTYRLTEVYQGHFIF